MTHLNIQQSSNVEIVSANLIQKLYETALATPSATLAGNLQCEHCKLAAYEYLMGNVEGTTRRFPNLAINVTNGVYLDFVDPEVERVLMANGASSDSIGITESDAASFNIPTECFKNNTTITSFPEYGKFTYANGYRSNQSHSKFQGCTNLTQIDMSEITATCQYDFSGTAITTINAPKLLYYATINNGRNWASYNTHLTTVTSLGSITIIPQECFAQCTSLTTVNIPSVVTSIKMRAFTGCTSLKNITFPQGITEIAEEAFKNCSKLCENTNGVLDLSDTSITSIGPQAFANCNLTKVYLPTTVISIGRNSTGSPFNGNTNITEIKGLDSVTTFYGSFYTQNILNAIYMGALQTTILLPITVSDGQVSNVKLIYLPSFTNCSITNYSKSNFSRLQRSMVAYLPIANAARVFIKLIYFKNVTLFDYFQFYGASFRNVVINNVTPPPLGTATYTNVDQISDYTDWNDKLFGVTQGVYIYVPDSAVSAYQADSKYNIYTIRGINEVDPNTNQPYLTRYATNALWEAAGKPDDALIEEYM